MPWRKDVIDEDVKFVDGMMYPSDRPGLGIELNSNRGNAPLPGEKWLKIYRELGGEIVTLGSDAHRPQHIACAMEERQELLKACGFGAFCTFDAGQPVFHRL